MLRGNLAHAKTLQQGDFYENKILFHVWVAVSYGMRGTGLPADVNADGIVNVQDLVAVAAGVDAAAVLPLKVVEEVLLASEPRRLLGWQK